MPVPSLAVQVSTQRYARLAERLWRFESLDTGFAAEVAVDDEGIVTEYAGLFRLVSG